MALWLQAKEPKSSISLSLYLVNQSSSPPLLYSGLFKDNLMVIKIGYNLPMNLHIPFGISITIVMQVLFKYIIMQNNKGLMKL